MDFRILKTFELVAAFMNFNRAAEALNCTQSTVSAQIKSLELDLGTPLFERLGRRIALTPAGVELQRRVRRLLSYESEVRAAVSEAGETTGLISLRVPQSVAELHLPTILQHFYARYPRVGLDVSNCGYFQLPEELRTGEIDAGFLLAMDLESADLCSTEVLSEPLLFVVARGSALASKPKVTLHDLGNQRLLLAKHDCAYRMKLQQDMVGAGVQPAALVELSSLGAVVECVRAGLGVSLLPERMVASELAAGRLASVRWDEPLRASLYFVRHRDKPLAGAFGAFVQTVEAYFEQLRMSQCNTEGLSTCI